MDKSEERERADSLRKYPRTMYQMDTEYTELKVCLFLFRIVIKPVLNETARFMKIDNVYNKREINVIGLSSQFSDGSCCCCCCVQVNSRLYCLSWSFLGHTLLNKPGKLLCNLSNYLDFVPKKK